MGFPPAPKVKKIIQILNEMTRLFVNTNVGVLIDTFILHADLTTFQKYFSKEISNTLTIRKKNSQNHPYHIKCEPNFD